MAGAPLCECHGEPKYRGGAGWQCAVKQRERSNARYANLTEAERDRRRRQQLERWHRADGGYMQRRRRHLAAQRGQILERLQQLDQEANSLVPEP